jgi:hypothetical protein
VLKSPFTRLFRQKLGQSFFDGKFVQRKCFQSFPVYTIKFGQSWGLVKVPRVQPTELLSMSPGGGEEAP